MELVPRRKKASKPLWRKVLIMAYCEVESGTLQEKFNQTPRMMLLHQKFLHRKRDSRNRSRQLAVFRNQRGIQALRQCDVLRVIAGNGVFCRHCKRRIHPNFTLGNFYEAGEVVTICDHLFGHVLEQVKGSLLVMIHHRLFPNPV